MSGENLLKYSFVAIVGIGVSLAITGVVLCLSFRSDCDKEFPMAQERIERWGTLVITALASFKAGEAIK